MSLIADGLLIATCLTTAVYCLVLSRRLRRLSDTGEGVGQQIVRLNKVLEETRASVGDIRATARSASDQLAREIAAARREGGSLQRQIRRARERTVGPDGPETRAAGGVVAKADRDRASAAFTGKSEGDTTTSNAWRTPPDIDDSTRGGLVPSGDGAEAGDHWPLDEADPAPDREAAAPEADFAEDREADDEAPFALTGETDLGDGEDRGAPSGSSENEAQCDEITGPLPGRGGTKAVAGLLRVERMAV